MSQLSVPASTKSSSVPSAWFVATTAMSWVSLPSFVTVKRITPLAPLNAVWSGTTVVAVPVVSVTSTSTSRSTRNESVLLVMSVWFTPPTVKSTLAVLVTAVLAAVCAPAAGMSPTPRSSANSRPPGLSCMMLFIFITSVVICVC